MAAGATISSRHGLLAVDTVLEVTGVHVLDAGEGDVAVAADRALAVLGQVLSNVSSAGGADRLNSVGLGAVGVSAGEGDAVVSHFIGLLEVLLLV